MIRYRDEQLPLAATGRWRALLEGCGILVKFEELMVRL